MEDRDRFGDQLDLVEGVHLTMQSPAQEAERMMVSFSRTWEMNSRVCLHMRVESERSWEKNYTPRELRNSVPLCPAGRELEMDWLQSVFSLFFHEADHAGKKHVTWALVSKTDAESKYKAIFSKVLVMVMFLITDLFVANQLVLGLFGF